MLDTLFLQILNMSITASVVIIFLLFVRLLLKNSPKIFSYMLWSVVLFRLVCPFSFESSLSLLNPKAIPDDIIYDQVPQVNTSISIINDSINALLPVPTPYASINPLQIWFFLGSSLWIMGMVALMLYSLLSFVNLHRKLKDSIHEKDNIFVCSNLTTPFVMGLLHPKIYIPANLTATERKYIILHEQTHIKRLDHLVKLLSFFVLCLHWFNPLVWVAFFMSGRDMEMSCDEKIIKILGSEVKKDYSTTLLRLSTGKRIIRGAPLAFGEGDTKSRIKNILNYKKPVSYVIVLSILILAVFAIGMMTNPKSDDELLWVNSAKDLANRYTLALASGDITEMRQLTPTLDPPVQEVLDTWKQIKIESVSVLREDIRESKAVFELSVTVKQAPDGFGMWTPGTATHYLYAEKCSDGWYVESYAAGGRMGSDLEAWWNQPNLI